jgi:hypothetical protein
LIVALGGCGDLAVSGNFLGDATLQINGQVSAALPKPKSPAVAALWLGYSGLVEPDSYGEVTLLPISAVSFPTSFRCEVLDRPPDSGVYATFDGGRIDAFMRIATLAIVDDVDSNGRVQINRDGSVAAPDVLLARSNDYLLLFIERVFTASEMHFLSDWSEASLGYHLVAMSSPDLRTATGHIVANDKSIPFVGIAP